MKAKIVRRSFLYSLHQIASDINKTLELTLKIHPDEIENVIWDHQKRTIEVQVRTDIPISGDEPREKTKEQTHAKRKSKNRS